MNVNKCTVAGRLTRDPELRFTPAGLAICKIGVAVNQTWYTDGQKKEKTAFVDADAFGKTAEAIAQYFKKGAEIYFDGRLETQEWKDKATGQKRMRLGVVLEGFQFIGGKNDSAQQPAKPSTPPPEEGEEPPF